ncbi:MAG: 3-phosphoserine/phosphohydroxythreonine transaminase [Immundisolibacteraceae bacterium]|nr:3-phosphoserine/phosphohydroxythreonine transaminase [Immundisolibacteraceae bacterium]
MARVFNFSAGPAALPVEVLEQVREEMLDWHGEGMSVMEMSHRGKAFVSILEQAEADLRELLAVPSGYKVLFLQGGASAQFSMVPLNLASDNQAVDYVNTGSWSKKAIAEAKRYCQVSEVASSAAVNFSRVPTQQELQLNKDAAYLHYTSNNTIFGTEFHYVPDAGTVPLVCDASSNILSRPIDVSRFGLIYAGAQKNIGPAGMAIVIVRDDLIGNARPQTPTMMDYLPQAENDSCYNTPPTFAIYVAGLVFKKLLAEGGLEAVEAMNIQKSSMLYTAIDNSDFYQCPTELASRSRMNVPFTLANSELDGEFLKQAAAAGLVTLKGHRSVGGMRASIYNAMPVEGVVALVDFMESFARQHG